MWPRVRCPRRFVTCRPCKQTTFSLRDLRDMSSAVHCASGGGDEGSHEPLHENRIAWKKGGRMNGSGHRHIQRLIHISLTEVDCGGRLWTVISVGHYWLNMGFRYGFITLWWFTLLLKSPWTYLLRIWEMDSNWKICRYVLCLTLYHIL